MRSVLDRMRRARRPPLHSLAPADARQAYAAGAEIMEVPAPALPRIDDFSIPMRDGRALPARAYAPSQAALPLLLYFHGGGFTVGSIATHDILCRVLARDAGCAVVSVDYRLAPEWPFPAALEDSWDALRWLHTSAGSLGLDATRLAVGGDSAGGTLAAVCALMARDAGIPLCLQLLFYPGCAARMDAPSHTRFASGFVLEQATVAYFFDQYLPSLQGRMDWRFAPMEAAELHGVAPTWLGLAECDPMVDDGLAYADRLRFEGVAVDLELYRGVVHEFIKMGRMIPEARRAHADAAAALRRALAVP